MRGAEPAGRVGKHIGFAGVLPSETRYHVHHEEEPASDAKSTSPEKITEERKIDETDDVKLLFREERIWASASASANYLQ